MNTAVHLQACKLVRERKAPNYRAACSLIAKRRHKPKQPVAVRELRLPYRDD
jgi:hypothetical protein